MVKPLRGTNAELAGLVQRHVAVFNPRPQTTRQLHGANPFPRHFRQYPAVKAGVMRDVPRATVVVRNDLFDPRLIRHHRFGNAMDSHRLRADGAIGTHQMAHWVDDFTINHVDRGHFHYSALKIASFGIDDAQH